MKTHYTIPQNIFYTLKNLKKREGNAFFISSFFHIISSISATFFTMALASFVIELISKDIGMNSLIFYVLLYTVFLLLMDWTCRVMQLKLQTRANLFRQNLMVDVSEKILSINFTILESDKGKDDIEKALEAVYSGNAFGFEGVAEDSIKLTINILGLLLYAVITAKLNLLITLALILCSIINLKVNKLNVGWIERNKDAWTSYDTKIRYLKTQCIDLKNSKDIRLYKIQHWFINQFYNLINKRMKWYKKEYEKYFSVAFIERFTTLFRDLIVYGYLLYKVMNGMSLPVFILYIGVVSGFSTWIRGIFDTLSQLQNNNLIINNYRYFMEQPDSKKTIARKPIPKKATHKIQFENVTFTYPNTKEPLFKNLNLTIKEGEKVALVGLNGAGKTTLIKLLCGLYSPDSGKILLDDIDIKEFNINDYFNEFSVVFQDVYVFAFTIAQNIACTSKEYIDYDRVNECIKMAGLKEKVDSLSKGINTPLLKELDEDGILLSGGELQKLILARALYKNSSIIVLDEPTSALDPVAESEMYSKYNSFSSNKTSLFISHRLSSTKFCTRILFMKNGEILEDGTHEELMKNQGEYEKMFKIQAHYYQKEVEENVI